jgi:PAS domain S-box-containing protein
MTDDRMAVTFVHGQILRKLPVSTDQLIGRTLPDLLLDGREDHPLIQGHVTALGGHETTVRIEWGGNLYSARIAPLRDAAGRVNGCVGIQQQIGWLPEDDLTVREGEVRLQRIIDWNIVGIAFGDDQGHITDANDAFLQMAGYSRDEVMADEVSWPALMPVEFHTRQLQALQEILTTGRCAPFETSLIRSDGKYIPALVAAARLSVRRREGVAFVLDLSPFRKGERWLRAELAIADVLADGTGMDALGAALTIVCDQMDWLSASIWQPSATGAKPTAHAGTSSRHPSKIGAIVQSVLISGEAVWHPVDSALILPLGLPGQPMAALLLIDRDDAGPEQPRVAAARAVAARLTRFLSRLSADHA